MGVGGSVRVGRKYLLAAAVQAVSAFAAVVTVAGSASAAPAVGAVPVHSAVNAAADAALPQATGSVSGSSAAPLGSVAGGFVPLPGRQVARVRVGARKTVTVHVTRHAGVPASGAGAVALAVATTATPVAGAVRVFPAGDRRPGVPTLTWTARRAASGQVITKLPAAGKVRVANTARHAVTVTIDAVGYWLAGTPAVAGAFGALRGRQVARVRVGAHKTVTVAAAGRGGIPRGAGAVSLGVSVTAAAAAGRLTVYPAGTARPAVPDLSWAARQPAAGLAITRLRGKGKLAITNTARRAVTVTLDATGYWLAGAPASAGAFGALRGRRVARVRVGAHKTVAVHVARRAGVPAHVGAAVLALAATATRAAGAITVYPSGSRRPGAATLTWAGRHAARVQAITRLSRAGKVSIANRSRHAVTITIAAAGYWLSKARTVTAITPKPATKTVKASTITHVTGSPNGTQTVTLAKGAAVPAVKRVLTAGTSKAAPYGLLGTVTAVASGPNGTHILTLRPASLSQAYSRFSVSTSQVVTSSEVTQPSGTAPATGLSPGLLPAATGGSGFGFNLSKAAFSCSGSAGPAIALTADLSKTRVDLSLNTNPRAPSIHFLVTADPVFDINVGFTGQVTCKLAGNAVMTVRIPIPGTPDLEVDLKPVVALTAGGQASLDFRWAPRAAIGFDKGPGISTESHGFGSSGSVAVSATAGADLFLGLDAELALAGRVGVGGDFGPDLGVTYDASAGCVTVDGELKADLTADVNVFVKDWTFALATGIFLKKELYRKCIPVPATPPVITTTTLPSATAGTAYTTQLATADNRAGTWKITTGNLPADLTLSGDKISGKPATAGTSTFTVKFTDTRSQTATASVTLTVLPAPPTSGAWTPVEAPLPSDAGAGVSSISGVSCPTATSCLALGYYTDTSGYERGMQLTWNGTSWTTQQTNGYYYDVSCGSASFCVSVNGPQVSTWTGGSWTSETAPVPPNADTSVFPVSLADVSCSSPSFCVAIGNYTDTSGNTDPMLLTLSNGSWAAKQAPVPPNAASGKVSAWGGWNNGYISCPSSSFCVAAGNYTDTSGNSDGMLLTLSGGSWTAEQAPLPANAVSAPNATWLAGVSCVSASFCDAGGVYTASDGGEHNLLLTWRGQSWAASDHSGGGGWGPVSCVSASFCAAVVYGDGVVSEQGLTWTGGAWAAATFPSEPYAAYWSMLGLACSSTSFCVAVGNGDVASGSSFDAVLVTRTG